MGRPKKHEHCTYEDCTQDHYALGFCCMHYARFKTHGDPGVTKRAARICGSDSPFWKGNRVGYAGAHMRVRRARGKACENSCNACGGQASDWALRHTVPNVLYGLTRGRRAPYSPNIDDYDPMCRSCHTSYDLERRVG